MANTKSTGQAAPAKTTPATPASQAPVASTSSLKAPAARDNATTKVAAPKVPTRNRPDLLNHDMHGRGSRLSVVAIPGGSTVLKLGAGNKSVKPTSVWGQTWQVAQKLASASKDGHFTAQAFYNALYENAWAANGARPKYDPANIAAYSGWILSIVRAARQKGFRVVETVPVAA